jgi:N-methylhydantoinase A/oxoprolinase/acetone carboxylase beta subunit
MSSEVRVKIGIDVGGTFTHAVALDAFSQQILGKVKVLTTHDAPEGVARGIIQSLERLIKTCNVAPEQVVFIAHSTTQATNALLEGDLAKVGIIGLGTGASAWLTRNATTFGEIPLSPGKFLQTVTEFIDTTELTSSNVRASIEKLKKAGAQALVIAEAFSVDDSKNEHFALSIAEELGILATTSSEISQLYGLRMRTRTAVLNAAMLPKMVESAELTERCVREAGIKAPLMIMRSDGGVMDIESMRRRPIYTMLSGPAAGVAAALMFLRISDGIFLEVGGTSTDISAIHNGRSQIRSASIGGNNLLMKTLDIQTVGVAGGSLPRFEHNEIVEVGPRSAHIANYQYVSFADQLENPEVVFRPPLTGDAPTYLAIKSGEKVFGLTPTCAANLLGLVPTNDCASGNLAAISKAFEALARLVSRNSTACAEELLKRTTRKIAPIVKSLIKANKLDPKTVVLYGGGGGAAAIVPYLAKQLELTCVLSESSDLLSAIGVALALLRETVERQVIEPSNDDMLRIRHQAIMAVQTMGADPSTVDVFVEYDAQKHILRATATGATSTIETKTGKKDLSPEEKSALVAQSMRLPIERVGLICQNNNFAVYGSIEPVNGKPFNLSQLTISNLLGFVAGRKPTKIRVIDRTGSIRYQATNGEALHTTKAAAETAISDLANRWCRWGDAGKTLPNLVILAGNKFLDFSGLLELTQISALAKVELDRLPTDEQVIIIATPN